AGIRWVLKTIGRLSRGIALGCKSGFDSGVTLDYVYENNPQGITPLGRMIDRAYLNSVGWRGIRVRRNHLERMLGETVEQAHAGGRPVRLLDIASGPGRSLLDTLREMRDIPITALLRDYKEENLAAARRIAADFGLTGVSVVHGDAFDRASLAAVTP